MGLIFKGNPPTFNGDIKVEVPTSTYSGKKSNDASDSINPYTSVGPGVDGVGLTNSEIDDERLITQINNNLSFNIEMGGNSSFNEPVTGLSMNYFNNTTTTTRNILSGGTSNSTRFGTSYNENKVIQNVNLTTVLNNTFSGTISISIWIKDTGSAFTYGAENYGFLYFVDPDNFPNNSIYCFKTRFGGKYNVVSRSLSGNIDTLLIEPPQGSVESGTIPAGDSSWHHYVFIFDYTNSIMYYYLDGVQALTSPLIYSSPAFVNNHNIFIGTGNNQTIGWDGELDNLTIYNRVLNSKEVNHLYLNF